MSVYEMIQPTRKKEIQTWKETKQELQQPTKKQQMKYIII